MANEMRDRLVELIRSVQYLGGLEEKVADHLIENGVVVPQWISVKDRLPEKDGKYMVVEYSKTFNKQYLNVSSFAVDLHKIDKYDFYHEKDKSGFYGYSSEWGYFKESDVTHWMSLPEPPKAEQKLKEMRGV